MKQMIKILNCKNKNYKKKLVKFLDKSRSRKSIDTIFISKILNDVKKNKLKAVIKYERLFSKNSKIYASKNEINATIKKLDSKTRRAIDFAYSRIYRFHSLQKPKDIKFVDKYKIKLITKMYLYSQLESTCYLIYQAHFQCVQYQHKFQSKKNYCCKSRTNGKLNSAVMYAAKKCGVTEVITCGGAQAIGNLAYIQKVKL